MNLEQQKKQARELLRALRAASPEALTRLRTHHRRWADADTAGIRQNIALHDAQFVIAREQGFAGWTHLKSYADPTARITRLFVADLAWLSDRVDGLLKTRRSAGPAALEQIRVWHPRFHNSSDAEILEAPFARADAELVYAREHGFETWQDLAARVSRLAATSHPETTEPFLAAYRALEAPGAPALPEFLRRHPGLARQRGTNGNTLLNLAVSLKQPAAVDFLLEAGADPNDANNRGWTPLHQAAYSNQSAVAAALIQRGADLDAEAHGSGGTPLVAALFWGHREVADLLSRHSTAPGNLRTAAGLGNSNLLETCFRSETELAPEAFIARGFYRPHSGFPDWTPSPDRQEVLDEALVWAAKSGRAEVFPRLLQAGARLDSDPYRGTPLIWAAANNRLEAAAWLIDRGAAVNLKATFGGPRHGQGITAMHLAAQHGHLPMVQLLIRKGADPAIREDLYQATPETTADFFHQIEVRDYLRSRRT